MPDEKQTLTAGERAELACFLGENRGLVAPSGTRYSEGEIEAELDRQLDKADMAIIREHETEAAYKAAAARMIERARQHDILRKEAALLLVWLSANECLTPGAMPKALEAVRALKHRL